MKRIGRLLLPPVVLVAALAVYSLAVGSLNTPPGVRVRESPWIIAPQQDEPLVASDAELLQVLARVQPPSGPANTNNYIHALRLWGTEATFDAPETPSGADLLAYFLDDAVYRRRAGNDTPALFVRRPDGLLRARSFDDSVTHRPTSSFHSDDLLATFGEVGLERETVIRLRDGEATVGDLAKSALLEFNLARHEYEWSAISYARYVFPLKRWQNKFGETISSDDLVDLLIDRPKGIGPCNGLHRLEALTVLLRVDQQDHGLSSSARAKIARHLQEVSRILVESQTAAGYWTRNWPQGAEGQADEKATIYDKLLVTGHHLEWMALAPPEVTPPREAIVRAARWTLTTILEISDKELQQHYGPLSHAARALCLWRGKEANEFWQERPKAVETVIVETDEAEQTGDIGD